MVCPFCLHKKTQVTNSRPTKRLNQLWRRRQCLQCNRVFTTREAIDLESVLKVEDVNTKVTKKYSRATLFLSILQVCDHLLDKDEVYWICDTIDQRLLKEAKDSDNTINKQTIIATCLEVLKRYNTPAFVKYLSYHTANLDARSLKRQLKE